jgi:hypothetical protein
MDKSYAYISVNGKENTALVSKALNLEPTSSWNVGDKRKNGSTYDFSHWEYMLPEFEQEFVDESLENVVAFIEKKQLDFTLIPKDFNAFISCAGWHESKSPGFHLSKELIAKLGRIGLAVDFDLYCCNE